MAREIACAFDRFRRPRRCAGPARRGRGLAASMSSPAPACSVSGLRPVVGIDPTGGVAVVVAAPPAAVRHPRHLAGRRRHQLRDARTRPPDARPRSQADHLAVSTCGSRTRGRRSPSTCRELSWIRPRSRSATMHVSVRRRGGWAPGTTEVRDTTTDVLLEAAGPGSGRGVAHATSSAPRERGQPSLRAVRRPGDLAGRAGPLCRAAGRNRRWCSRTHADRLPSMLRTGRSLR